jgi:regulatory protein
VNEALAFQKAKEYSFLLLKFRLRSEKEISERLKKKKFPEQVIKAAVAFLKEKKFIDDKEFARTWIESRIKRPLGLRRLKEELRAKGIDKEIIETNIREIKQDYPEADIVAEVAAEKLSRIKGVEPQKAKSRVYAYLLRRGFSSEVVIDTINKIKI